MRVLQAISLLVLFCSVSVADELPTAAKIYSELNKRNPTGLTRDEVIAYLRKYDPRFNVPEYVAFGRSNPAFQHIMDGLIAKAADDIMLSGTGSGAGPGATPTILPKKDFLTQVAKTNPAIPKEPKKNYLADFSKEILHIPGLLSDPNLTISKSTTVASDVKNPANLAGPQALMGSLC